MSCTLDNLRGEELETLLFFILEKKGVEVMVTTLFLKILGFGFAIPCSILVLITFITSAVKENYIINMKRLIIAYSISIIGWAIVFGFK